MSTPTTQKREKPPTITIKKVITPSQKTREPKKITSTPTTQRREKPPTKPPKKTIKKTKNRLIYMLNYFFLYYILNASLIDYILSIIIFVQNKKPARNMLFLSFLKKLYSKTTIEVLSVHLFELTNR